jgi:DNA repair exonuclease SbcCD nuclease subunit
MRFVHTADWQIGMKAAHVGPAGDRVREERLTAARRVVAAARDHNADFLLVAGDTFEDNGVDRLMIQKVADLLAAFGGPVFVLPGNHDPLEPGSVWEHAAWSAIDRVWVLREEAAVAVLGGMLFACPARSRHSGKDPTAWITGGSNDVIRIGVAHGTVEGIQQEEPDYPIPRTAASRAGLDYLALGHWHSTATYPAPDGPIRMAYSGTHEQTKFGERDSGNVLLVEIDAPGAAPRVTPLRTGAFIWNVIDDPIRQSGDVARVTERIAAESDPGRTLLDVRLTGLLAPEDRESLVRLRELTAARFLFARVDDTGLRPAPEDDAWVEQLPAGIIREVARRLRDLADPAATGSRPVGASPEVAARALLDLYALKGEAEA